MAPCRPAASWLPAVQLPPNTHLGSQAPTTHAPTQHTTDPQRLAASKRRACEE